MGTTLRVRNLHLVYSTQRCEALHRSIKQKVTSAKMRLIDIVKGISDYNIDARDRRKCDAVRLAIRHHLTSQELPPYLDRLRLSICPYAFELLKAQAQRVLRYHATPLSEDAGKPLIHQRFLVTIPGKPMSRAIVETTDDGELKCTDIEEDFGLKDSTSASGRTANLLFCSCQWDVSSGLDLCVHRMKIMTLIGDQLDDGEQILGRRMASKWKILTPEREQEAIMLLKARKAVGHDFVNVGREAPQRQTSYDRKRELLMEMRELAKFACVSDTFTQKKPAGAREDQAATFSSGACWHRVLFIEEADDARCRCQLELGRQQPAAQGHKGLHKPEAGCGYLLSRG